MRSRPVKILGVLLAVCTVLALVLFLLARKDTPETVTYGISFNASYAHELGLDTREVLGALISDLGVRHFRLSAHWSLTEPQRDQYDFEELDAQLAQVEEAGGSVIFAVGRRLPRWPECHVPGWAQELSWDEQKQEIRDYLEAVITRYKDSPAITHWQVENEPYLSVFAYDHCGEFDEAFLEEETSLVRTLDASRPILVTDSGNLGTWFGAYKQGDAFGTSVYVYFWNPELGQFKTVLPPWYYRVKENIVALLYGRKETMLIELSAEPWLLEPVTDVPIEVQYSRMDADKFNEILEYALRTRYDRQYLWGGEWWYWLRERGHPEMWERARELYDTK